MFKRFVCVATVVILGFSLAACGARENEDSNTVNSNESDIYSEEDSGMEESEADYDPSKTINPYRRFVAKNDYLDGVIENSPMMNGDPQLSDEKCSDLPHDSRSWYGQGDGHVIYSDYAAQVANILVSAGYQNVIVSDDWIGDFAGDCFYSLSGTANAGSYSFEWQYTEMSWDDEETYEFTTKLGLRLPKEMLSRVEMSDDESLRAESSEQSIEFSSEIEQEVRKIYL